MKAGKKGEERIAEFERWLTKDGLEPRTCRTYANSVAAALKAHKTEPWKVLASEKTARKTKIVIKAALRKWAEFSEDEALADALTTRAVKKMLTIRGSSAPTQRKHLTPENVNAVLKVLEGYRDDEDAPRWLWPCLSLMIKLGLRSGVDLTWIRKTDVEAALKSGSDQLVIWSKRNKQRPIPVGPVQAELKALVAMGGWDMVCDLISPRGAPERRHDAAYEVIRRTLKGVAEEAGLDPADIHTHGFRHAAAQRLWNKTKDILKVRDLLGHNDIATTQLYLGEKRISEIGSDVGEMYDTEDKND